MTNKNVLYLLLCCAYLSFPALKASEDDYTESDSAGSFPFVSETDSDEYLSNDDWNYGSTKSMNERDEINFHFKSFYCSGKDNVDNNDTFGYAWRMERALFIQCLMQAESNPHSNKEALEELIQKKKSGKIKEIFDDERKVFMVYMTDKDLKFRLLSSIPSCKNICLINGKIVTFQIYNYIRQIIDSSLESKKKNIIIGGTELALYGYNFTSDKKHNQKIEQQYKLLFQK